MCKNDFDKPAIDFEIDPTNCEKSHEFIDLKFDNT